MQVPDCPFLPGRHRSFEDRPRSSLRRLSLPLAPHVALSPVRAQPGDSPPLLVLPCPIRRCPGSRARQHRFLRGMLHHLLVPCLRDRLHRLLRVSLRPLQPAFRHPQQPRSSPPRRVLARAPPAPAGAPPPRRRDRAPGPTVPVLRSFPSGSARCSGSAPVLLPRAPTALRGPVSACYGTGRSCTRRPRARRSASTRCSALPSASTLAPRAPGRAPRAPSRQPSPTATPAPLARSAHRCPSTAGGAPIASQAACRPAATTRDLRLRH